MARTDVFVDTSGLYALIDKKDAHHGAARDIAVAMARAGRVLVLTDYVIAETATLAKARSGGRAAVRVIDFVEQSASVAVERIDAGRFEATTRYFRKHIDHAYSFTDCTSFLVMRELRLVSAITSDHHFREAGFEPLLPSA